MAVRLAGWTAAQGVEVAVSARPGALDRYVSPRVALLPRARGSMAGLLAELRGQVNNWKPDILHAHQRREALAAYAVGRMSRSHTVEHVHNELQSRAFKSLSFRSEHVFCVSESIKLMAITDFGVDPSRITVVDNVPVNVPDRLRPVREDRAAAPELRILAVGRVDKQKDPHRFVRVVRAISRLRTVRATWIGDGPLLLEMQAATTTDDVVSFTGPSFDIARAIEGADALLITSSWEGMPLVALEALAAGTPVIATAVGGLAELLAGERCGLALDPVTTDDDFAAAVVQLLENHPVLDAIRQRGRDIVMRRYNPDVAFAPILQMYAALTRS